MCIAWQQGCILCAPLASGGFSEPCRGCMCLPAAYAELRMAVKAEKSLPECLIRQKKASFPSETRSSYFFSAIRAPQRLPADSCSLCRAQKSLWRWGKHSSPWLWRLGAGERISNGLSHMWSVADQNVTKWCSPVHIIMIKLKGSDKDCIVNLWYALNWIRLSSCKWRIDLQSLIFVLMLRFCL